MEEFLIWLAANWLWILLIAVVAAVVIIVLVKHFRKNKNHMDNNGKNN